MATQLKPTAYRFLLGVLLFTFVAASCNNKKEKEEPAQENTEQKVDPPPPPAQDTMKMDTADTRPVKPGD